MSLLQKEIRVLLASLNQFIRKMPQAKVPKTQLSIKELINVPNPESEASLNKVLKNLQYKYNFLKIAYPSILTNIKLEESLKEEDTKDSNESVNLQLKFDYNLYWNNVIDNDSQSNNVSSKGPETNKEEKKEETQVNNDKSGKYIMKDGKLVKGEAERRSLVDFSNWVASHVDPEDLKKHRELLDRQHFRGPVWEGKKIPPSILDEQNPLFNTDVEPEVNPNIANPKKEVYETVKR